MKNTSTVKGRAYGRYLRALHFELRSKAKEEGLISPEVMAILSDPTRPGREEAFVRLALRRAALEQLCGRVLKQVA